jgi:hypothetical protein
LTSKNIQIRKAEGMMRFPKEIDSSIRGRVADMNHAVESGAYISALSLALTIPDVCGLRRYHDVNGIGNNVGKRYAKWFDEYVAIWDYREPPRETGFSQDIDKPTLVSTYFTGSDCYRLRCSYLHEASNVPNAHRGVKTPFATIQFRVSSGLLYCDHVGCLSSNADSVEGAVGAPIRNEEPSAIDQSSSESTSKKTYRLDLDLIKFFSAISSGVTRFLEAYPGLNDDKIICEDIFYRPLLDFRNVE